MTSYFIVPVSGIILTVGAANRQMSAWQPTDGYIPNGNKALTPTAFKTASFYRLRWYTDYLPMTKPKTSSNAQVSVARFVDPQTHAISFLLPEPTKGWIDLPFWYYSSLHYQVPMATRIKQSKRGGFMVNLKNKVSRFTIQHVSISFYCPAVLVMLLTWVSAFGCLVFRIRRTKQNISFT